MISSVKTSRSLRFKKGLFKADSRKTFAVSLGKVKLLKNRSFFCVSVREQTKLDRIISIEFSSVL